MPEKRQFLSIHMNFYCDIVGFVVFIAVIIMTMMSLAWRGTMLDRIGDITYKKLVTDYDETNG